MHERMQDKADGTAKISVVCPTFNSAAFVKKTLMSVASQTVLPHELIVSDDGSTDETVELVRQTLEDCRGMDTVLVRNEHRGPGATRNSGLESVTGDWVAFIDSDDLWLPTKLEAVVRLIEERPEVNFICHNEIYRRLDGTETLYDFAGWYRPDTPLARQMYRRCMFHTSAVVCRMDLLRSHGFFDPTLMSSQDFELWLRLAPYLTLGYIKEVLGCYVERKGNISSGKIKNRWHYASEILYRHRRKVGFPTYVVSIVRFWISFRKAALLAMIR